MPNNVKAGGLERMLKIPVSYCPIEEVLLNFAI